MVDYNKYFAVFDGIQDSIAKTWSAFIYAMSLTLMFISKPIDMLLSAISEVQNGAEMGGVKLLDLSWVFKLVFSVFGFLYVFSTDSTDTVVAQPLRSPRASSTCDNLLLVAHGCFYWCL